MRIDQRTLDQLRDVTITRNYTRYAEGSVLVEFGHTKVLCTASIDNSVPRFLKGKGQGWVTAEYGMLPRATHERVTREAAKGRQSGRTQEIQRLIGRSLRAVIDLKNLGERQIKIDCDVIQADGGTRTASISGGFVALYQSVEKLKKNYNIQSTIIKECVAAVSAGIIKSQPNLDLDFEEDSNAEVDANFVICESGKIAEIQVTGEEYFFTDDQFQQIFDLSRNGIAQIIKKQKAILNI